MIARWIIAYLSLAAGTWLLGCGFQCKKNEPFWKAFFFALAYSNAVTFFYLMSH